MNPDQALTLRAGELSTEGFCEVADNPRTVAHGALPGELITAQPIAKRKRRLFVRVTGVDEPSVHRVQPACGAAAYCGGCTLQHVSHDYQLETKQAQVAALFADCQPQAWLPPLRSKDFYHYRTKARLGVKYVNKKEAVLVGFREKLKPFIVETDGCPVLAEPADRLLTPLAKLIEGLSVAKAVPQVELAMGDADMALVFRHLEPVTDSDLDVLAAFGAKHGAEVYLQPGGPDSIHRIWPDSKASPLKYQIDGMEMMFMPTDFTQVNLSVNREMVALALSLLQPAATDHVFDAFCGIGNFSLPLAKRVATVHGVEGSAASVDRARMNAAHNHVTNASFAVADLYDDAQGDALLAGSNKILLDPPRTGAERLCEKLASSSVERVVYVSCKPQTLARDVRVLIDGGFALQQLGIIDMFPHTTHVESIALLTRETV